MSGANQNLMIQRVLQEELLRLRAKNASFSLRALARKLAIPAPAISEILQGKRGVSKKRASQIADRLLMPPDEKSELMRHFAKASEDSNQSASRTQVQLSADQFRAISDWYHFAILSLAETSDFDPDPEKIAKRLGLNRGVVEDALERLLRLRMIERGESGRLRATGFSYKTTDEIQSLSLRKAHATNLELAARSLERDAIHERDFNAMTIAIDPSKIPSAKKRIRKFLSEMNDLFESENKTEVYKICLQMFPLSRSFEGGRDD